MVPAFPSANATSLIASAPGLGAADCGVIEKSSIASPSSAPDAFKSLKRIQTVCPAAIERPVIVEEIAVRFAAALPSSAPAAAAAPIGPVKSSALTSVQVPVVRLVASKLIWKSSRSVRVAAHPAR